MSASKKKTSKKKTRNTNQATTTPVETTPASITGDHFTLEQVAAECIGFQTEHEQLQEKKGSIADHFMNASTIYITAKPDGEPMAKDHPFLVACKAQEELSKSPAAGLSRWEKIPASWSQMKSNIKAAYNMGLDINSYKDEFTMRNDLNAARKAKKEDAVDQVEQGIADAVEGANPEVNLRLHAILNTCKDLTDAQSDEVLRILDQALESIVVMKAIAGEFREEEELEEAVA